MASVTHTGVIKHILETQDRGIVEEYVHGESTPERHVLVNTSQFSQVSDGDSVDYYYNEDSDFNNGRDVTFS